MEKEITLTLSQLKSIFISGGEFFIQNMEVDMGEREEIDAPDFGEVVKQLFDINI